MNQIETATARFQVMLEQVFEGLKNRVADLGMNLSVHDDDGRCTGAIEPRCEFCRQVCGCGQVCADAHSALAGNVLKNNVPHETTAPTGCQLVALPVKRRRRIIGVAVACFTKQEILDEEQLARLCDRLRLDRQVMARLANEACARLVPSAGHVHDLLRQLLDDELAAQASQKELANLSINLTATYEELSLVYRISRSMQVTREPRAYLQSVCDGLREVMGVQAAIAVVYAYSITDESGTVVVSGDCELPEEKIRLLASTCLEPCFGTDGRGIVENDFRSNESECLDGMIKTVVAVPLVTDGPPAGILMGLNKIGGEFNSIDLKLLRSVGTQSAVFLENNRLYADLQSLLMGVLHALTASIDAKDPYTCGHSRRVALISRRLAEDCGFDTQHVHNIYLAGLLHDIGKIGVPGAVLRKRGHLTEQEYVQLKSHPVVGAKILGDIHQLEDVIPAIRTHHERPDGSGYPSGLKGNEMTIEGRIVGLADCFDAMTSDRTYRQGLSLKVVCDEIRANAGTQFDAMLVEKMLSWDLQATMEELYQPSETVLPLEPAEEQKQ
ncbi:MAG: HD domain-containing protein [Phycisphaerae bacterium]|jgi:putative nucleotidyltransferase with HDIG domain|nr:HD domain-containing protein [Phycisphaerae bacterium]